MGDDPLAPRLFGYGALYRAVVTEAGSVLGIPVTPRDEAKALAAELRHVLETAPSRRRTIHDEGDSWGVSIPFGRCGIEGRPREYLKLVSAVEAWLDVVSAEGAESIRLSEGDTVTVEPGQVVRLRGRAHSGRRVLVAFQTEDRTPLLGNAAPFALPGEVTPAEAGPRLAVATEAFLRLQREAVAGNAEALLQHFFGKMSRALKGGDEEALLQVRREAEQLGSYASAPSEELFDRQRNLLSEGVVERIQKADAELFRFPGMLGAVSPLFPLLNS